MTGQSNLDMMAEMDASPAPDFRDGQDDGAATFEAVRLPPGCPVTPLGSLSKAYYFLDFRGQLIELGTKFDKGDLKLLFGPEGIGWLVAHYPESKWGYDPETREKKQYWSFQQDQVQTALGNACTALPLFDPTGKLRGRGAHRGHGGEIVVHCGDRILIAGEYGKSGTRLLKSRWVPPGLIGNHVYSTAPALARADDEAASLDEIRVLEDMVSGWNWVDRTIAVRLVIGFIGLSKICGAVTHRPHMWVVGPSGAGKSELQWLMRELNKDWSVDVEKPSEAGIRQLLKHDTLPVFFDEPEAGQQADIHVAKIIELARLAFTGGKGVMGSQDHKATEFTLRSTFFFSSIAHRELDAQDRNRMAILKLSPFVHEAGDSTPYARPKNVDRLGRRVMRRMAEQWARWDNTLLAYQKEMQRLGYSGREQDCYGTLLAAADLMLHDRVPDAISLDETDYRCAVWAKALAPMIDVSRMEAENLTARCIAHLSSYRLTSASGQHQETVARWIMNAVKELLIAAPEHQGTIERKCEAKLETHGMKLVNLDPDHGRIGKDGKPSQGGLMKMIEPETAYLAVANKLHRGMQDIFDGSTWKGGVWTQSLALFDGAVVNKKARFAGASCGCVLVPLKHVIDVATARDEAKGAG